MGIRSLNIEICVHVLTAGCAAGVLHAGTEDVQAGFEGLTDPLTLLSYRKGDF